MANGDTYIGDYKNGEANGAGMKVFANGDSHEGQYLNDKRHGYGVYKWKNGDVYRGQWMNGKMNGRGTKYMAEGSVYDGVRLSPSLLFSIFSASPSVAVVFVVDICCFRSRSELIRCAHTVLEG